VTKPKNQVQEDNENLGDNPVEVKSAPVKPKVPTQIYLGPNLPSGRLQQSAVFRGGIPIHLESLLKERPEIKDLIVPISSMIETQRRIEAKGTAENVAYQLLKGAVEHGI